jgi:hypothetical protein
MLKADQAFGVSVKSERSGQPTQAHRRDAWTRAGNSRRGDGFLQQPFAPQNEAEVAMRVAVARVERNRHAQKTLGQIVLLGAQRLVAQRKVGGGIIGFYFEGMPEGLDRLRPASRGRKRKAAAVAGIGVLWIVRRVGGSILDLLRGRMGRKLDGAYPLWMRRRRSLDAMGATQSSA